MTKEQLLEEAKRRYPIGTEFIPVHVNSGLNRITTHETQCINDTEITFRQGTYIKEEWCFCVYKDGRWAIITKSVQPVINNSYSIY